MHLAHSRAGFRITLAGTREDGVTHKLASVRRGQDVVRVQVILTLYSHF